MPKSLVEGAPPPIPQDARRKPSREKVDQAQRTVGEFMLPEAAEVAGELALVAKKARDDFHEHREIVLELTKLVGHFYKKNPKSFEAAKQLLDVGDDAWMVIDEVVTNSGTQAYRAFNKLHLALNTLAQNVQPAKKIDRNVTDDDRKKIEMILVKEENMDPEQAKEMLGHMSDEEIKNMISADGTTPPKLVRYRGKMYRRASILSQLSRFRNF